MTKMAVSPQIVVISAVLFELRSEKAGFRGFRLGPTQPTCTVTEES